MSSTCRPTCCPFGLSAVFSRDTDFMERLVPESVAESMAVMGVLSAPAHTFDENRYVPRLTAISGWIVGHFAAATQTIPIAGDGERDSSGRCPRTLGPTPPLSSNTSTVQPALPLFSGEHG